MEEGPIMNIYLAGSTKHIEYLKIIAQRLRLIPGVSVSSTWLDVAHQYTDVRCTREHLLRETKRDLEEIAQCGLFILDREGRSYGKITEQGAATLHGKPIWLVRRSPIPNAFDVLAQKILPNFCSVFAALGDEQATVEMRHEKAS
jgi:hypothetical protein